MQKQCVRQTVDFVQIPNLGHVVDVYNVNVVHTPDCSTSCRYLSTQ
jgi:hypothetical protein